MRRIASPPVFHSSPAHLHQGEDPIARIKASFLVAPLFLLVTTVAILPAADAEMDPLVNEAVVEGPAVEVWRLITTKAGMESWIVPHAQVDLRVGGLMRANRDPDGRIGDPHTITSRIVAIVPKRLFSVRIDDAPGLPFSDDIEGTWYEIHLNPLTRGRTRVRCVGHGFASGPMGLLARTLVDASSAQALRQLQEVFAERSAKPAKRT